MGCRPRGHRDMLPADAAPANDAPLPYELWLQHQPIDPDNTLISWLLAAFPSLPACPLPSLPARYCTPADRPACTGTPSRSPWPLCSLFLPTSPVQSVFCVQPFFTLLAPLPRPPCLSGAIKHCTASHLAACGCGLGSSISKPHPQLQRAQVLSQRLQPATNTNRFIHKIQCCEVFGRSQLDAECHFSVPKKRSQVLNVMSNCSAYEHRSFRLALYTPPCASAVHQMKSLSSNNSKSMCCPEGLHYLLSSPSWNSGLPESCSRQITQTCTNSTPNL